MPGIDNSSSAVEKPTYTSFIISNIIRNNLSTFYNASTYNMSLLTKFPPDKCKPKRNIFYLKTFKTASSVLTTMFYRMAWRYDLNILPIYKQIFPHTLKVTQIAEMPFTYNLTYNILAEHMVFDEVAVRHFMPEDTVFVTSLRQPLAQFKSYVYEYLDSLISNISDTDPVLYILQRLQNCKFLDTNWQDRTTSNQLGISPDDSTYITHTLRYLDGVFDFVLITEYLDESLVLLKRKLCWEMKDIVYISIRQRSYASKKAIYDQSVQGIHYNCTKNDYAIYNHYLHRLIFLQEKENIDTELEQFRKTKAIVASFCQEVMTAIYSDPFIIYNMIGDHDMGKGGVSVTIEASPWNDAFEVTVVDCAMMNLKTKVLRNMVRMRAIKSVCLPHVPKEDTSIDYNIRMNGNWVAINSAYCTHWSPKYNLPMTVFTSGDAYMKF